MGEAILARLLAQGVVAAANVMVAEPVAARRDQLASDYAITCSATNREAVEEAETVVLAVKPQTLKQVFSDLSGTLVPEPAGVLHHRRRHPALPYQGPGSRSRGAGDAQHAGTDWPGYEHVDPPPPP